MPVMRRLHVGGTTYDTVGEASVTQVQTSGTKIATVSIDGASTDIYAPAGGSSVDPATAAPSMDGTAAVGSSAKYAREDHVHPTDTSRQAALVSGTNIKTVMGASLLGSGNVAMPTASTSTLGGVKVDGTTITAAADGTISASGGSGGGSTLTLYTNDLNAIYFDSTYTTPFDVEYFDYDNDAEWAALCEPDVINIVYSSGGFRAVCPVVSRFRDRAEDGAALYFLYKSNIKVAYV